MTAPKVSIIVPVYGAEAYLSDCVESILAQTYASFEVILVDDGSPDRSGEICDEFAARDSRVRVIHQANAGVSAARNAGLDAAAGEWIGFVDADDRALSHMLETALRAAGESPIVMWDSVTVSHGGKMQAVDTISRLPHSCVCIKKEIAPDLLAEIAGAVWHCLYRRELLRDVRFPVGIKLSEDRLFNLSAMGRADSIAYIKEPLYEYFIVEGSACRRYHGDIFEKNLQTMEIARDVIGKYWGDEYLPIYTRMFVIGGALHAIDEIANRKDRKNERIGEIREIVNAAEVRQYFAAIPQQGIAECLLRRKNAGLLFMRAIIRKLMP